MDADEARPEAMDASGDDAAGAALREIAAGLIARAEAAHAARRLRDAAVLLGEALRLAPHDAALHARAAAAFLDAGDADEAERLLRDAAARWPDEGRAQLALGRFYAQVGRFEAARAAFQAALDIRPDRAAAREALRQLTETLRLAHLRRGEPLARLADAAADLAVGAEAGSIAPDLAPRDPDDRTRAHAEGIALRQFGRRARSHWGLATTLSGLDVVRGVCLADTPILEVQILLDGRLIHRGPVRGGYPLPDERERPALRKYVFNIWLDVSPFSRGRHRLEIRCVDMAERVHALGAEIVIAAPPHEAEHPGADAIVTLDPGDPRAPAAQVAARPSMTRPPQRALLPAPPRAILVQRVDQLGDLVVSVPALRRLRALFPGARIVGLLSTENVEAAQALELFDEVIAVAFPADPAERRRTMSIAAQAALRARLAPFGFDLAIDLSEDAGSRPLLLLSGAARTFGFPSDAMPSLSAEGAGATFDVRNRHEIVPHANKLLGLVEWLGAMAADTAVAIPHAPDPALLAKHGIAPADRFVLIHAGARLPFARWPHMPALAASILERTDCAVVMLDEPGARAALPPALLASPRFRLIEGRLPFAELNALLAACAVMVGNDSGPKHLAALRGTRVVSIHMARNNWNEWGQQGAGAILSRRLPCAGCLVQHAPEECGRDFTCLTGITADEVFAAVAANLAVPPSPGNVR